MTIKYTYSYTYILNTKFMLMETDDYLDATFTRLAQCSLSVRIVRSIKTNFPSIFDYEMLLLLKDIVLGIRSKQFR